MAKDTRRRIPLVGPCRPLIAICDGAFAQASAVTEFPEVVPVVRALAVTTFSDKVPSRGTFVQTSAGTTVPDVATSRGMFAQTVAVAKSSGKTKSSDVVSASAVTKFSGTTRFSGKVSSCGTLAQVSDTQLSDMVSSCGTLAQTSADTKFPGKVPSCGTLAQASADTKFPGKVPSCGPCAQREAPCNCRACRAAPGLPMETQAVRALSRKLAFTVDEARRLYDLQLIQKVLDCWSEVLWSGM